MIVEIVSAHDEADSFLLKQLGLLVGSNFCFLAAGVRLDSVIEKLS